MDYQLSYRDTHLKVSSAKDRSSLIYDKVIQLHRILYEFIAKEPLFLTSYQSLPNLRSNNPLIKSMLDASQRAGVGPMAAVAGALAQDVGSLLLEVGEGGVVVENGGDIFLKLKQPRIIGIHACSSSFSDKLCLKVTPKQTPLAVCTSSGCEGHSVSLGEADAVVALAKSGALADAAATSIANEVLGVKGLELGVHKAKEIKGLLGAIIIKGDEFGSWGWIPELVKKDFDFTPPH